MLIVLADLVVPNFQPLNLKAKREEEHVSSAVYHDEL